LLVNRCDEVVLFDGFAEVVVEGHVHDVHPGIDCREHDNSAVVPLLANLGEHVVPGDVRHPPVQKHDVDVDVDGLQGVRTAVGDAGVVVVTQPQRVHVCDFLLVVDDKNSRSLAPRWHM
jgi:hypothetical protein